MVAVKYAKTWMGDSTVNVNLAIRWMMIEKHVRKVNKVFALSVTCTSLLIKHFEKKMNFT